MAGKMWCCGGGGSGSGGGLTSITTADSPTVDLEGDGSAGAPLTATVLRSADAGNKLTTGTDGGLFVPTPTDTTVVVGQPGSAPGVPGGSASPVGTSRSVDVSVTESTADTFTVAAQLSPAWWDQQDPVYNWTSGVNVPIDGNVHTVPEDGVYRVTVDGSGLVSSSGAVSAYSGGVYLGLRVAGAIVAEYPMTTVNYSGAAQAVRVDGSTSITRVLRLTAGQALSSTIRFGPGSYVSGDAVSGAAYFTYVKIAD